MKGRRIAGVMVAAGVLWSCSVFGEKGWGAENSPASVSKVSGVVTFEGEAPARREVNMSQDAHCVKLHGGSTVLDENVIVSPSGHVKNAFVYIDKVRGKTFPMPEGPAVLDQKGCMYTPRIQGVRVGQTLEIRNSDPLLHNIRSLARTNRAFNIAQPKQGMVREKVFKRPEPAVKFKCDIHKWMTAYVFVFDHPYFSATDEKGAFAIEGLPPGEYVLQAWHETFGKLKQNITVSGDVTEADFVFKAKKD